LDNIVIGREAYDKIMYFVHKAKFEISGLGNVQIIDGVPTVTDIILLKQENDPTETEMDADAVAKAVYDHHVSGMEGELKFWWHSHVNMEVFWSGTDKATIKDLTKNGWFIHGVFNKKNEFKCAYSNFDEISKEPIFVDNLDLVIDENIVQDDRILEERCKILELEDKIDKIDDTISDIIAATCKPLFDTLVTDKVYKPTYMSGGNKWRNNTMLGKLNEIATVNTLASSTTHTSGKTTTTGISNYYYNSEFTDPDGAIELFSAGYTEEQIHYMQDSLWIYDIEDVIKFENEYGGLDIILDGITSDILPFTGGLA
jgi:hypothetical protein